MIIQKLKNIIMGEQDFVKKNYNIVKFVSLFTREPITEGPGPFGEKESPHWLYCNKTNVKLLVFTNYLFFTLHQFTFFYLN